MGIHADPLATKRLCDLLFFIKGLENLLKQKKEGEKMELRKTFRWIVYLLLAFTVVLTSWTVQA